MHAVVMHIQKILLHSSPPDPYLPWTLDLWGRETDEGVLSVTEHSTDTIRHTDFFEKNNAKESTLTFCDLHLVTVLRSYL